MSGSSNDSSNSSHPQMSPEQALAVYTQYLPSTMAITANQAQPVANSLAGAAANANPIYTASGLNQLNSYAPGYQQAGANLANAQTLSQADLLAGSGGLYALEGAGLTNLLNPAQAANNAQAANLVNSINLNGLSNGETAAIERSTNQGNLATGNLGVSNGMNTTANAMNFGNALQEKRAALGSALNASNAVAQSQNTAFNPVNAIANASNTSNNFGLTQFNPTQANSTITTPYSFSSSLGNQVAGVAASPISSGSSSGASGGCCFIFMEAYRGFMPAHVRECRDRYYRIFPEIALGYCRMAKWLVPAMRHSTVVREFVWKAMIKPLTEHGAFVKRLDIGGQKHRFARKFWFTVWLILGR